MIRLFRVFVPVGSLALLSSEILLITSAFILATYLVLEVDPTVFLLYDGGLVRIFLVLGSILLGIHFHDLYSKIYVRSRVVLAQQLCLVMGVAFLVQGVVSYIDADLRVPIRVMILGSVLAVTAIFAWRVFFSAYVLRVVAQDRLLLVGKPSFGGYRQAYRRTSGDGSPSGGYVTVRDDTGVRPGGKVLGPVAALREIIEATQPNRIVVGMSERRNAHAGGRFAGTAVLGAHHRRGGDGVRANLRARVPQGIAALAAHLFG